MRHMVDGQELSGATVLVKKTISHPRGTSNDKESTVDGHGYRANWMSGDRGF